MSPMADDLAKHALNARLYGALLEEDSAKVKELCFNFDEGGLHILTIHDDTVLQAATYSRQSELVLGLLEALPPRHLDKMTRQNHQGNTILHDAATSGSTVVAKKVLEITPGLLCMRNHLGETALFSAVRLGNQEVFNFLVEKIDGYPPGDRQPFLLRSDKSTILHMAVLAQHLDLALHIAKRFKHLTDERDGDGMTALQLLSCNPGVFYLEDKRGFRKQILSSVHVYRSLARREGAEAQEKRYNSALDLAKLLIARETSWAATYSGIDPNKPMLHKYGSNPNVEKGIGEGPILSSPGQGEMETEIPLFLATKSGCIEIAEEILKVYPQAVEYIDHDGRNVLHRAIKYRRLDIFELLKRAEVPMKRLVRKFDKDGNSILHTVGLKSPDYVPQTTHGPALELQEELLWFERVAEVIPRHLIDHRNNMKQTAEVLFARENKELRKRSIEWLKRTAEGCSIVVVLIATVAFAAAYTVPGGPSNSGTPVLLSHPFFTVFAVCDVLSLSFALTSVVIFLSILTSSFRLAEFKHSLPNRLMLGFTFLFLSVSMMMISFAATVLLMINQRESWKKVFLYALSFLPVGIFALAYFPLYLSLSASYKYLLYKARQIFSWHCFTAVLSRLASFFSCSRNPYSNASNPTQLRCPRSTSHNQGANGLWPLAAPETPNFCV